MVRDKPLEARDNPPDIDYRVKMGDTKSFTLKKGKTYGSIGFDGCIGVLIIGSKGAIIGHYASSAFAIGDSDPELNGREVNPKAAVYAIPNEYVINLGDSIKTYIFAKDGTDQARIGELNQLFNDMNFPTATNKWYSENTVNDGAGFYVDVGKYFGTDIKFDRRGNGKYRKI